MVLRSQLSSLLLLDVFKKLSSLYDALSRFSYVFLLFALRHFYLNRWKAFKNIEWSMSTLYSFPNMWGSNDRKTTVNKWKPWRIFDNLSIIWLMSLSNLYLNCGSYLNFRRVLSNNIWQAIISSDAMQIIIIPVSMHLYSPFLSELALQY